MTYAVKVANSWIEIASTVALPDRTVSEAWVDGLTDQERADQGFLAIVETDAPKALRVTGSRIRAVAGVPTRQWLTEAYADADLAAQRTSLANAVRAEAARRILVIMPERERWRSFGLAIQMITTQGASPALWPADKQAAYAAAMIAWAAIQAVETASDTIEAAIPTDAAGLAAFDVAGNASWPA